VPPITEITVLGGDRYRVAGNASEVEAIIVDAARGSLMSFAWLVEAGTGERVALNPEHIVGLRTSEA
jgi:hypothetical protein